MSKRILVVDDEPEVARLITMCLAVEGYDVAVAASGFAALEAVAAQKPDLVVLDIMMLGMSGYEVCRAIKSRPGANGIRIIFLTAKGNPGDAQWGMALGAEDYIIKPFDPGELLDKVRGMIGPA